MLKDCPKWSRVMFSPNLELDKIKESLREQFDVKNDFTVDLSGVRSISPSFAYRCFGRLYEEKEDLEKLLEKIKFKNDRHNFEKKIVDAIKRRIFILS